MTPGMDAAESCPPEAADASGSDAGAWLRERLEEVPPELARAVRGLLDASGRLTPPGLASAAIAAFDRLADRGADRGAALELLAADALLTYAFEAAAEPGLGGRAVAAMTLAREVGVRGALGVRLAGGSG